MPRKNSKNEAPDDPVKVCGYVDDNDKFHHTKEEAVFANLVIAIEEWAGVKPLAQAIAERPRTFAAFLKYKQPKVRGVFDTSDTFGEFDL